MKYEKNNRIRPIQEKKTVSPEAKKRAILLAANVITFTVIYFAAVNLNVLVVHPRVFGFPIFLAHVVMTLYWIALAVFLVVYVIYNRAFSRKGITIEMLPDTWTAEQKTEFVEDGQRRLESSKWMLSVIIPLLVPIMLDAIYLFTWPMISNLFSLN
ncbi:MAG: hypothetical protein E7592_01495 [Ruminococcaceae bacterium]|nr:hypothetical protein [Oscillospiraceae bacterium]